MQPSTVTTMLLLVLLVSGVSGRVLVKRESGNANGNDNIGSDNGGNNGNCHGTCLDNDSGNFNGNFNEGSDNGNDNGNCEGNCIGNESGNANGNENINSSDNGNENGNCVGNCFHNIDGNGNGNANTDSEKGSGNGLGNCEGNCFHRSVGNGQGNVNTEQDDSETCRGNCFGPQPLNQKSEIIPNYPVLSTHLTCVSRNDFTYYVTPGTNCLEVHRVHNLPDQHAHLFQWTCPKGTAFDLSICGCNHWYMIQLQSKCTSSWFKWNGK